MPKVKPWMLGCSQTRVVCQRCKQEVITKLSYETSDEECMLTILLFIICLPLGVVVIRIHESSLIAVQIATRKLVELLIQDLIFY
uniref:LITAF domain-containing protein n=1 Tax=Acrobeloides nanus TaxID=290746 RepID=A0A914DRI4_9BILA